MSELVTLTRAEALQAAYAGVHRRLRAIFRGRQHRYGRGDADEWEADVQAAAAELAVARVLDRPTDRDDAMFVLVTGELPVFRVIGWLSGREGKADEYAQELDNGRPPCWMVPQSALRPIEELRR